MYAVVATAHDADYRLLQAYRATLGYHHGLVTRNGTAANTEDTPLMVQFQGVVRCDTSAPGRATEAPDINRLWGQADPGSAAADGHRPTAEDGIALPTCGRSPHPHEGGVGIVRVVVVLE